MENVKESLTAALAAFECNALEVFADDPEEAEAMIAEFKKAIEEAASLADEVKGYGLAIQIVKNKNKIK